MASPSGMSPIPVDPTESAGPTYTPGIALPGVRMPSFPVVVLARVTNALVGSMCLSSESAFWKGLQPYRRKTKTNGDSGKNRRFYEWDYTHGDVEVYDSRGNHLGSADPETGSQIK